MGRVVHFELFADDPEPLIGFYRTVFGWDVQAWQGPMEYYLAGTGPRDQMGIDGAIARTGATLQQAVVTVGVGDIDATLDDVRANGGQVVTEKSPIPGVGWQAYVSDPAGIVVGVLQPDMNAGMGAPIGSSAEQPSDPWADVAEQLRRFGTTIGDALTSAANSPQGQRLRSEAERAATSIGEASRTAADKARPHVISALDRVSQELGHLATRLRREDETPAPGAAEQPKTPGDEELGG